MIRPGPGFHRWGSGDTDSRVLTADSRHGVVQDVLAVDVYDVSVRNCSVTGSMRTVDVGCPEDTVARQVDDRAVRESRADVGPGTGSTFRSMKREEGVY